MDTTSCTECGMDAVSVAIEADRLNITDPVCCEGGVSRPDTRRGDRHAGPPKRTLRGIEDDLWQAAQTKAASEGRAVSAVIGELLAAGVTQYDSTPASTGATPGQQPSTTKSTVYQ